MLPTEHGKRLAQDVRRALEGLATIFDTTPPTEVAERPVLSFEVMAPIAQHWLLPRLRKFRELHPDIVLDVRTTPDLVSVESGEPSDLALRYGDGHWRGLEKLKVAEETVFPVCSPEFLQRHPGITLDNFRALPLLLHSVISWQHWFEQAGLPAAQPANALAFNDVSHVIGAALIGDGIAMARALLVEDYLKDGRLVKVFDIPAPGTYSYWLAWQNGSAREPLIDKLRRWIVDELSPQRRKTAPADQALPLRWQTGFQPAAAS
jgi:LysR family glycine cleavage system transcriptional activator